MAKNTISATCERGQRDFSGGKLVDKHEKIKSKIKNVEIERTVGGVVFGYLLKKIVRW